MAAGDGVTRRSGWYHGWNIVAVCILSGVMVNGLPVNAFSLFLKDWSADLHAPISTLTLGLASLGVVSALLSPIGGVLTDKYPIRWIMAGGLGAMVVFCFALSFVTEAWQLIALFAVVLPSALVFSASLPANAIVSRWFVRRLGLALGLTAFGLGLAGVILPPLIAAIMPSLGWRAVWRLYGVFTAVVAVPLLLLVLRDRPAERDGLHYMTGSDGKAPLVHGAKSTTAMGWREVMGRRNFWLLIFSYVPMVGMWSGLQQNMAPIVVSRGLSVETASILLSVFSLAHISSTLIMGFLSDRFGNKRPMAGLAWAVTAGGIIVAFGHDVYTIGLGVALVGASGGIWTTLAAATAVEYGTAGFGRAFGLLTLFTPLLSLAPFFVAKTQEITNSYVFGLCGLAAIVFAGGIGCFFIREPRKGQSDGTGKVAALGEAVTPAA